MRLLLEYADPQTGREGKTCTSLTEAPVLDHHFLIGHDRMPILHDSG